MTSSLNKRNFVQGVSHFFLQDIVLIVMGSIFFYLSFPNAFSAKGCPFLIYFFAIFLFKSLETKSFFNHTCVGLLFGFLSYALLVNWVCPIDWMGYGVFVCALALQVILFSVFYRSNFSLEWINIIFPPALWVATEYIRTNILGGFAWTTGHALSFSPYFIQIMDITGPYGVSFFILLINVCLYRALVKKKNIFMYFIVIALSVFFVIFYAQNKYILHSKFKQDKALNICTVQPNILPSEKLDPDKLAACLDEHIAMSHECVKQGNPDMIVWPEVSIPDDFITNGWIFDKVVHLAQELKKPLLLGSALLLEGKDYNSAALVDSRGNVTNVYHKQVLIPFSEYYPFKKDNYFKKLIYKNKYDFISGINPGLFHLAINKTGRQREIPFGVVICSEEVYPKIIKDIAKEDVCFISTLLNDGWFTKKEALMMHAQVAIAQAVSFKTPIIRSSNTGLSTQINDMGEVSAFKKGFNSDNLKLNQKDVFLFNVSCKKMKSFYSQFGDIFSIFCLFFVFIIIIIRVIFKKQFVL